MNISLYGSTGFIGKAFVYHHVNNLKNNIKLVPRYSRRPDPDTEMLYLISTTHNYNVFTDPTLDVKTNLGVLTETLESWKNHNPNGTFNFVSSWFVYGNEYPAVGYENQKKAFNETFGDNYYTYDGGALETDECHPRGFYSITKRCAEQLVISFAETFQMDYRILRLSNVLGKDTEATAQKNALQYLINKMKAGEEIEIYEGGNFFRNYMYVTDTVEADNFSKNHVMENYTRVRTITNSGGFNDILNVGDNEYVLTLIPAGQVPTQPYWVYQQVVPPSQQSSEENDDDDHTHNPNGINICPITGKNFDDSEAILATVNGGKTIKVCSADCKQKVENLNNLMT